MKTVSMLCLNLFLLPIFKWHLLCVVYIVIDFNVFLLFLGLRFSIQGVFHVFPRLSKCKFGNLFRGLYPRIANPPAAFRFFLCQKRCSQTKPCIHQCTHTHTYSPRLVISISIYCFLHFTFNANWTPSLLSGKLNF